MRRFVSGWTSRRSPPIVLKIYKNKDEQIFISKDQYRTRWKPTNGPDWASMSLKCVLWRTSGREEIVNMDEVYKHASKKMATVRENDFATLLDLNVFVLKNFSLEDIHHSDAIKEAHDYLESGWMERYRHGVILELLVNH